LLGAGAKQEMQTSDGSTLEPYNFIADKNIARSVTARLCLLLESKTRLQLFSILFGFKKEERIEMCSKLTEVLFGVAFGKNKNFNTLRAH